MAKKAKAHARARVHPKKSIVSKKAEIEKMISASKEKSFSETKSTTSSSSNGPTNVRLPPQQPVIATITASIPVRKPPSGHGLHPNGIKNATIPSQEMLNGNYHVRDQRHETTPEVTLVRLPCEPPTPRALRQYERRGYFPFLELPGELRNKVYDYAITKDHYAIEWLDNNQKNKSLTYRLPRSTKAHPPRLQPGTAYRRRLLDYHHRRVVPTHLTEDDIHPGPTILLFVCKTMSEEAASVFYSKSMFHFHGLRALRHFLDRLRPTALKSITRLALNYRAYGHPVKTEDQRWKEKHDHLWEKLCWRVADNCSLTHLALKLTLPKSPTMFCPFDEARAKDISTRWILPLWAFQDAGIQRCWAQIRCASKDGSELQMESLRLRREIIGDLWDEEAESTRDDYGWDHSSRASKEVKKGMVLRLRVDGGLEVP